MKTANHKFNTRRMVVLALFCAIAYATMFVLRIKVSFLTFDAKDAVITIAAMIFGPGAGALIALVVSVLEMITVSDTGFYGWIMNFVSSTVFAVTAGAFYRHFHKVWAAVCGLCMAAVNLTVVMLVMNLIITPIYTGMAASDVAKMIPALLLPFNLTKAVLNAALVMVLYKPVSTALKKAKITNTDIKVDYKYRFGGRSLVITIAGVAVIVACVVILIWVLGGNFSLIKK